MKKLFIISRFNEDVSWIKKYTNTDYLICNKGEVIPNEPNQIMLDNSGGNQKDIFNFIFMNYNNLPDIMIFVQGLPWDHCREEVFKKLITRDCFTQLESYEANPVNEAHKKDFDGLYMENNNNWYLWAKGESSDVPRRYKSFDDFMNKYFKNYVHLDWLRFSPGSMYIVEKKQALSYSRKFWQSMLEELPRNNMAEGHLIERAMFYILCHIYQERDDYK
jgi:hypothetical protein